MNLDIMIKAGSQILFSLVMLFFVIYSVIGIYSLTTYGRTKSLTSAAAFIYAVFAVGLVSWGLTVLTGIK